MIRLTWDQVRAWRVARHHLDRRVPRRRLVDVVGDVCGLQAQVQSAAELQAWARVDGLRPSHVRDALWKGRTLVRTWAMRGTLHLLPARDLPLYVAALRTHDRWWKGAWLRMIGFTEKELRGILDAIASSLGSRPLTRAQLAAKVGRRAGPKAEERMLSNWGEMLKPAAFQGVLISGPPQGQNVTFVRPDRWLEGWKEPAPEQAWREIVRRYLHVYGPASREDFARWWGTQPAPAGRILNASADELAEVEVEGYRSWALAEDVEAIAGTSPGGSVRLLPAFDVYTVGNRPRASLVGARFEDRVFRAAGWISPVVLADGWARGVWNHERRGDQVSVTMEPFGRLTGALRPAIAEEAEGLASFLGGSVEVSRA